MKSKSLLMYFLLVVFLGTAILVYQSESSAGNAAGIDDCIQIKEGELNGLSGLLILESRKDDQPSFVLDLATGEKRELANLTVHSIVGPSKAGLLTYYDHVIEAWVLVDLTGGAESVMDELGSAIPIAWLTDGRLVVGGDRLQVLDLESGEMKSVIFDLAFAQIYEKINWSSPLNWDGFSTYRIVPGTDLQFLAYAAHGEPGTLLVLWDQDKGQEVARVHWADTLTPPQWAPDGRSLITSVPPFVFYEGNAFINFSNDLPYVGGTELMEVGIDGSVRRLTTFTSSVKAVESRYRWSADGKRIAFGLELRVKEDTLQHAAVVNLESGEVTVFCFPARADKMAGFPVWFQNGSKLALSLIGDDRLSHAYIVDVESGKAIRVEENVQVVGWWGD